MCQYSRRKLGDLDIFKKTLYCRIFRRQKQILGYFTNFRRRGNPGNHTFFIVSSNRNVSDSINLSDAAFRSIGVTSNMSLSFLISKLFIFF